ncbi:hypothetical protein [Oceanobacillus saliphilus]|uniref:hypothetical protein n=1 Tax=Oceanobacillus saliphilus TaxID=2925834 RepID=UPI00201D7A51|nr:hypothetical protein [Oceanobacillus saliphilus]
MNFSIILIIIVCIIAFFLTIREVNRSDSDYDKSSKKNVTRLSLIYIVVTVASLIALAAYIVSIT